MNIYFIQSAVLASLGFAIYQLSQQGKFLMSTQEAVDQLTAQVAKVKNEVVVARDVLTAKLADVQAQLDAAGVTEQVDLTELTAAVQSLDDINPDEEELVEVPVEEPVVDPVPEPVSEEPAQDAPPF